MKNKRFRIGNIILYRFVGTLYIGIHPAEVYRRPGIRFTIIAPPTKAAEPPYDAWRAESWHSVRRLNASGEETVEIEMLGAAPLDDAQIAFFGKYLKPDSELPTP